MKNARITAAARVIYEAARHHRWLGFDRTYESLDPIGRREFDGIVEQALVAADRADAEDQPE
jgi:hypothetical protein